MSFSLEFTAQNADDAQQLLNQQYAPYCVKEFVSQAIRTLKGPVYVKAQGHLHTGSDYNYSSALIEVKPIVFAKVKE